MLKSHSLIKKKSFVVRRPEIPTYTTRFPADKKREIDFLGGSDIVFDKNRWKKGKTLRCEPREGSGRSGPGALASWAYCMYIPSRSGSGPILAWTER